MPKGYRSNLPRRNPGRALQVFTVTYGIGPWACSYCGDTVFTLGRASTAGRIHHKNEDPTNNSPENLCVMHGICHNRHHRAGKPGNRLGQSVSDETKRKISDAAKLRRRVICACGRITYEGQPISKHQHDWGCVDFELIESDDPRMQEKWRYRMTRSAITAHYDVGDPLARYANADQGTRN